MKLTDNKVSALALGMLWALVSGAPAIADDTELFLGGLNAPTGQTNILLILDDSVTMEAGLLTQDPYNPTIPYAGGGCDLSKVYWSIDGYEPSCTATNNFFDRAGLKCKAALDAFATPGGGTFEGRIASYNTEEKGWEPLSSTEHGREIECEADNGTHGGGAGAAVYPRNGDENVLWSADENDGVQWGTFPLETTYRLFDGRRLAWFFSPIGGSTRLAVVQAVAKDLVNTRTDINIGVASFNSVNGGRIGHEIDDVVPSRPGLNTVINALTATKSSPLSETLYEAALYLMGRNVKYGLQSVGNSRLGGDPNSPTYASPIEFACQKTHIVYVTDGEPINDTDADADIVALTDANGTRITELVSTINGGQCDAETYPSATPPWIPTGGECLDELAEFLHDGDLSTEDGQQNVTVHTVGFALRGNDLPILQETADRGGGTYYRAENAASLNTVLSNLITDVIETQSTFTSPLVSVNSFNRTRNLNDVFISVFKPSSTEHWPGNLKKYRLRPSDAAIVDSAGAVAIDPETGFFFNTAKSFWSTVPDGRDVEAGGAANKISNDRTVYTSVNGTDLTRVQQNTDFGNWLDLGPDAPDHAQVIDFINGKDAANHDNESPPQFDEPRHQMGDPLHSEAASVSYNENDATIYVATNDGYLHAIDADDGVERWAFLPPEFVQRQVDLFNDSAASDKGYGIDGSLRVQAIGDNDGVIEPVAGERVYLFFGMRRGGDAYYALDVTNPAVPTLLWRKDGGDLPGIIGQSWSSATPARMNIAGSGQSASKLVVVLGGGYDARQDEAPAVTDTDGNAIFILDSETGNLLWHGSLNGVDKDFAEMEYSIPADVKVIDFDGDGFADRMYAADMGGQVWRFDVYNGATRANLITGGVLAQLGAAQRGDPDPSDTDVADVRRFYYSPDVAMVSRPNLTYIHVGIGSGHRAHPLSTDNADRFYALRDINGLRKMPQSEYDLFRPTTDEELTPVVDEHTPIDSARGWKLELGVGEKVLAEARTFNDQVFFTTYTPNGGSNGPCAPALGTNRLYVMNVLNGAPVTNFDAPTTPGPLTPEDISTIVQGSIASQVVFLFPTAESTDEEPCTGNQCNLAPVACVDLFCMPTGFGNNPVRTFWRQENVD